MTSEREEHKTKLDALRGRLQEGEKSPLGKDFDFEVFLEESHEQYAYNP